MPAGYGEMPSASEPVVADQREVERLLAEIGRVRWGLEGSVSMLVETPVPHRHVVRDWVQVIPGRGFAGDHARKSWYRRKYVPGREVSAMTREVLDVLGVDPVVVGDNLITSGVDLTLLEEGDGVQVGEVLLERSIRPHRPCATFRRRSSPEAFAVARRGYRGALFVVREGGVVWAGDPVRLQM